MQARAVGGARVACPRVRHFVGDDAGEGAVAREEGGREEGEARILHPACMYM